MSTTMAPIHIRHKEGFHDQRIGTTFSAVLRLVGNICCNDGGIERHARPLDIRAFTPSTLASELSPSIAVHTALERVSLFSICFEIGDTACACDRLLLNNSRLVFSLFSLPIQRAA